MGLSIFWQSTLMRGTGATTAVQLDLDSDGIVDTRIHVVQYVDTGEKTQKSYFSRRTVLIVNHANITRVKEM